MAQLRGMRKEEGEASFVLEMGRNSGEGEIFQLKIKIFPKMFLLINN